MNKIIILQIGLIIELFITYIFCFFFFNEKVKKIGIITMKEYLYYNFGYINYPKTIVFMIIFIFILLLIYLIKKIMKFKYKKTLLVINILTIQILLIFTLFYFSEHCIFKLCDYSKPNKKDMSNENYISFIGIGDPQLDYDIDNIPLAKNRIENNYNLIKHINQFTDYIKKSDYNNIIIDEDTRTKLDDSKDNIIGLVHPGDMTQFGSPDGFTPFSSDILEMYEYFYNNNTEDKGLLNLDTYEIMGNHDYDTHTSHAKKIDLNRLTDNYPSRELLRRRNKYRKYIVNKDDNGNYSCNFGNLHVIFINIHLNDTPLSYSEDNLKDKLSDKPVGNLQFLKKDLEQFKNQKFIIVTHYYDNELNNTNIQNIIDPYIDNMIMILYGHIHTPEYELTNILYKKNTYKKMRMPAPAFEIQNKSPGYNYQFIYFIFDNYNSELKYYSVDFKKGKYNVNLITKS